MSSTDCEAAVTNNAQRDIAAVSGHDQRLGMKTEAPLEGFGEQKPSRSFGYLHEMSGITTTEKSATIDTGMFSRS